MNRGTQLKLKQLKVIIVAWLIIGFLIAMYDHLVLISHSSPGPSQEYSFLFAVVLNMGAGLTGALLGGTFLVFFVNVRYQDKPYGYTIITVSISFILIIALIALVIGIILTPSLSVNSLMDTMSRMTPRTFKNLIVWSVVVAVTQLLLQVNSKFGQGALWNIIRGKYNTPKEEKKIFMSLDLNSSTAIAEQLGDEVVVAWKYEDGIENQQCLRCFFDMKLHIHKMKEKYLHRYGLVPTFKAGMHCGKVIAGEVGIIKRDITYSGDVLNTTSRILDKCVEFDEEVIASSDLLSKLYFIKDYTTRPLGAIKLKGKEKELMLNALIPVVPSSGGMNREA